MTTQREEAEERTEYFIPMFEVGDIQALAEATDHSVSFLFGWPYAGPSGGTGSREGDWNLSLKNYRPQMAKEKYSLTGALALQQPFSHPPCPLKLVSGHAIPLPCW